MARQRPNAFNVMMRQIYGDLDKEQRDLLGINRDELKAVYEAGFEPGRTGWDTRSSVDARQEFFEYMNDYGYDISDFPWEAWRENYANAA